MRDKKTNVYALILAAGYGTRMGGNIPKQYLKIYNKPILAYTLEVFNNSPKIKKIIVVVSKDRLDYCKKRVVDKYNFSKARVILGGETGQESAFNGLLAIKAKPRDIVIIHDGVRPLIGQEDINRLIEEIKGVKAVVPVMALKDDVARLKGRYLVKILDRKKIGDLQTPQAFRYGSIMKAHKKAIKEGFTTTENSQLMRNLGYSVKAIDGSQFYFKLTYPRDIFIAQKLMELKRKEGGRKVVVSVERAIGEFKKGKPIILADSVERENEGDLCIPAEIVTPDIINFMISYCRGLVCQSITPTIANRLALKPMVNKKSMDIPAFTVTVDGNEATGVESGTSAQDRARTILAVIDDFVSFRDFRRPGHVFPLIARKGGVFERPGHTEASVKLARLAGFKPSAVICEILNEDGSMAKFPQLREFAKKHGFKITTIDKLIEYLKKEKKDERKS